MRVSCSRVLKLIGRSSVLDQIIQKPMDLGTIRDKMEVKDTKDGAGYKHIQDVCDDIRLVFSNAMTYNQVGTDVHVMAKTLSEKFEEKWKATFEPKLQEEVGLCLC
jgi:hypothetical protein